MRRPLLTSGALLTAAVIAGCASYSPLPLPRASELAASIAPRGVPPLDMNAVATLAVLNNPDLTAARAAMHVARAQAFAAGLLPDPQLTYSGDYKMDHDIAPSDPRYPEYDAYGLGLSVDLQALLTHSSLKTAAGAAYDQARLDLLWQEWQTVAEARTLYIEQSIAAERVAFLAPAEQIYARELERSRRALATGNATLEQTSADLAVLIDVRTQRGAADRSLSQAQHALRALLGVRPDVMLPLAALAPPEPPTHAAVESALARLPQSRPDLRALQAGYRVQESRLRAAVLSQFPDVSIGVTRARDVSDVHTTGFGVTLTLPIFDRGRGNIAIQSATREQLRAEYLARLDQSVADTWRVWDETRQLDSQLRGLAERLPRLHASADRARLAFESGDFPAASYLTLVEAYVAAESTRLELLQDLWTDSVALATILGTQVEPDTTGVAPEPTAPEAIAPRRTARAS